MDKFVLVFVLAACFAVASGIDVSNYELSRNKLGGGGQGYYPGGYYPSGPGGNYPGGNYPSGSGYYPGGGHHGPPGPPGAHPGCPLCDSSVYSYCSHKESHDACCCSGSYGYGCRNSDCSFLYANTCQEFNLISSCCCVDVKSVAGKPIAAPIA